MSKIRVGVLFGGKSAEHEVSLRSAVNVLRAIDRSNYDVVPIGIDKQGRWLAGAPEACSVPELQELLAGSESVELTVVPGRGVLAGLPGSPVDVAFPVLHGPYGEDGAVQGLLKVAGIPFVGAGVLGSAVGMDKDVMKRLLREGGIPIGGFCTVRRGENPSFSELVEELGSPLFVKPANLGSSVGVHKVASSEELHAAVSDAFTWDNKLVIEQTIVGREVECSVLGNEMPQASCVGEILTADTHGFYSYDAKYIDETGAELVIPARLPEDVAERVRALSLDAYRVLECEGLARVDSFVTAAGDVLINEINTLPGFTDISMYTKLWAASGVPQAELIDRLIRLALQRHARDSGLRTSR